MYEQENQYFEENDEDKKKDLKVTIEKLRDQLIIFKLQEDGNNEALKKYNLIKNSRVKPFFIWELEFSKVFIDKGGFDIVIGNPPYIGFHNVPNKDYFKGKYVSANGKYDFYVLFIEKGLQLLKENGYISYICPSYFYKRNYGKKLREFILKKTCIKFIADFSDNQIFDTATTYTCIFGFEKNENNEQNIIRVLGRDLKGKNHEIFQKSLKEPVWMLDGNNEMEVIYRIRHKSQFVFADITKSISQGIVTGNNDVFILNKDTIEKRGINYEFLKPIYKGKNIRNGKLIFNNEYIFYPYEIDEKGRNTLISEDIINMNNPQLYAYLAEQKETLLSRDYFKKSNKKWYELWNPRKMSHFYSRKFVFSEININNDFVLCNECFYSDSVCGAELKGEYIKYEDYVSKYLNSDVISSLYRKISVPKANGYLIYKNAFLIDLPIFIPDDYDKNFKKY